MIEYSHENRISFRFGNGKSFAMRAAGQNLSLSFARCYRQPESFKAECENVARLLGQKAAAERRRPFILMSGNVDAEIAACAFADAKVRFEPIVYRNLDGSNNEEIETVKKFCQDRLISPMFINIEPDWNKSPRFRSLILSSACSSSPSRARQMRAMTAAWAMFNGFPVLAAGELKFDGDSTVFSDHHLVWYWHAAHERLNACIAFFQYTPEQVLALLNEPEMQEALGRGGDLNSARDAVYARHWPKLSLRRSARVKLPAWKIPVNDLQHLLSPT